MPGTESQKAKLKERHVPNGCDRMSKKAAVAASTATAAAASSRKHQGNAAATMTSSTSTSKSTKKTTTITTPTSRKRSSPFRIKAGCVVALRFNPEGNQMTKMIDQNECNGGGQGENTSLLSSSVPIFPDDTLIPVWTNPMKHRDEGLALIGKRVRCFLPKHLVEGKKKNKRILEGQVLGVYDYLTRPSQETTSDKPWKIDLLIDKSLLTDFPFLVRTDHDLDLSQFATEKAKRHARLEETLKGTNKCTVRVRLSQPGPVDGKKNALKWVIQKLVPKRLFQQSITATTTTTTTTTATSSSNNGVNGIKGKTDNNEGKQLAADDPPKKKRKVDQNVVKHLGDKDDSAEQQIANWRWMCSRYHDIVLNSDELRWKATESMLYSLGFIGQVVKVESMPKGSSSLAMVSVRRMILPEHTVSCNSPDADPADIFHDFDNQGQIFRIPVEELVVLSRRVLQIDTTSDDGNNAIMAAAVEDGEDAGVNLPKFICRRAYSVKRNEFLHLDANGKASFEDDLPVCHRCRQTIPNAESKIACCGGVCSLADVEESAPYFCRECIRTLCISCPDVMSEGDSPPCYLKCCDCTVCRERRSNDVWGAVAPISKGAKVKSGSVSSVFETATRVIESKGDIGFGLADSFFNWTDIPAPAAKPVTRPKNTGPKQSQTKAAANGKRKNGKSSSSGKEDKDKDANEPEPASESDEDMSVFKPTCARLLAFKDIRSTKRKESDMVSVSLRDRPRNLREETVAVATAVEVDGKTNRRAERAKQRRLIKGISAFDNFDMDTLATRESQLRFDRSGIHAWGVFADKEISSGDMIVEYRGEIIENAMAEKREKLYEAAKIGSDYMFRIDGRYVCDATKVGNVARFVNASCDPNCYTKIINVDGEKRIVIYAKRDIAAGEELCYDYKFPYEYDPEKRIPCRCGASNCRGFMNWDKRYVVVGLPEWEAVAGKKAARKDEAVAANHDDSNGAHQDDEKKSATGD